MLARGTRRPIRFRRAPFVVSYWQDDELIFENYATGRRIAAEPLTAEFLHFFHRWRSMAAFSAHFADFTPTSLLAAIRTLEHHTLLLRSDRPPEGRGATMASWARWNPAAGFFHFSTKDVRYAADDDAVYRALRRKSKVIPPPGSIKRYPGARRYALPAVARTGEFPGILLARRTWREFSDRAITLQDLSTLLGLTWRVQKWLPLPGLGRLPLKTSPSGGARHPVEVYVLATRVRHLPPGLYHYTSETHQLELLRDGASARQIVRYLPTQNYFGKAAALMLMTAVFPRVQWKYEFPRAYRVVLADAGHLCQTFCLTATWLGLAPFCTMALADSTIEADLGLDGVTESVVYAAGVGARPARAGWSRKPKRTSESDSPLRRR